MEVLRFPSLEAEPRLTHGISTRPFNLSFTAGEEHGDPREGRRRLLGALGIDAAKTVVAGQVHGDRLHWVRASDAKQGALARGQAIPETDALATDEAGVGLLITAADCPPVLLWDAAAGILAVVHSGWRGTASGIVGKSLAALAARGASPAGFVAGIGPGIGPCCYSVGEEVAARVPERWRGEVLRASNGHGPNPRLDLGAWIARQLEEAGVRADRIERLAACTACETDRFFSHRAERGKCGRFGLAAAIR